MFTCPTYLPVLTQPHYPSSSAAYSAPPSAPSSLPPQSLIKCSDPGFLDLLDKLLRWDPATRMDPDQALQHVWIIDHNPPPTSSRGITQQPAGIAGAAARGGTGAPAANSSEKMVTAAAMEVAAALLPAVAAMALGATTAAVLPGNVAIAVANKQQQVQGMVLVGKLDGGSGYVPPKYDPIGAAAAASAAVVAATAASAGAAAASAAAGAATTVAPRIPMTDSAMGHHASCAMAGIRSSKGCRGGGGTDDGAGSTGDTTAALQSNRGLAGPPSRLSLSGRVPVIQACEAQVPGLGSTVLTSAPPPPPAAAAGGAMIGVTGLDFSSLRASNEDKSTATVVLMTPRGGGGQQQHHHPFSLHHALPPALQLRSDGAALQPTLMGANSPRNAGGIGAVPPLQRGGGAVAAATTVAAVTVRSSLQMCMAEAQSGSQG